MPPGGTTAPLNAPRRVSVPSTLCRRMSKTTVCFEVLYTTTRPVSPSATNTGPKVGTSPMICPSASRGRVHVVMRTTTAANATAHLCGRAMLPMSHLLEVSDETEVVRGTDGGVKKDRHELFCGPFGPGKRRSFRRSIEGRIEGEGGAGWSACD